MPPATRTSSNEGEAPKTAPIATVPAHPRAKGVSGSTGRHPNAVKRAKARSRRSVINEASPASPTTSAGNIRRPRRSVPSKSDTCAGCSNNAAQPKVTSRAGTDPDSGVPPDHAYRRPRRSEEGRTTEESSDVRQGALTSGPGRSTTWSPPSSTVTLCVAHANRSG